MGVVSAHGAIPMRFTHYETGGFFDEMFEADGEPRSAARALGQLIETMADGELLRRQQSAERALLHMGITFNVYGDSAGTERIFPFDLVPRIVAAAEWHWIERGLKQRIRALNLFIDDVYHEQRIVKDGVVPAEILRTATSFRPAVRRHEAAARHLVPHHRHRSRPRPRRPDLRARRQPALPVRRVVRPPEPPGDEADVSAGLRGAADPAGRRLPARLLDMLESLSPAGVETPRVVVLTPGSHNSAYFEHSFLAQQMGVELVEGRDLVVSDGFVWMRTTKGFERVDVIYRRIDDDFLDPKAFRADSLLGVPGLMDVYRAGRVALANAPGTGVADDKVVYAYVPEIVKYYLGEEILIPNVPTFLCADEADRKHVLAQSARRWW